MKAGDNRKRGNLEAWNAETTNKSTHFFANYVLRFTFLHLWKLPPPSNVPFAARALS